MAASGFKSSANFLSVPHFTPLSLISPVAWVADPALESGNRHSARRRQIVPRPGMTIASGKVARLIGDHDFVFTHRAHIHCLI